jgi:hypothetical protein
MWIAALFTLTITGLFFISRSALAQIACEGQPINLRLAPTHEQQIWGEHILSQTFIAPRNHLQRIDILFQTYQRQNTQDVNFRLLEFPPGSPQPAQGTELLNFTFNAATLQDQTWRAFTFPPISDSAGKQYALVIQSPESSPGNAITVGGIEWDAYEPGTAFLGPTPLQADIAFRACYQMTVLEKLQVLAEQITRHRPAVWGNIYFYGFIFFVYVLLLIGLFWKLAQLAL